MKVTVSIGPGPYDQDLLDALVAAHYDVQAIRSWPDFVVESWNAGEHHTRTRYPAFGKLRWLTWALWRRIPWARQFETPRSALYSLFDRLAGCYIDECDLFVGWSQVSMLSIEKAKRAGAITLLEHPMIHVDTWMTIATEEYAAWGRGASRCHSLTPTGVINRMLREYQAADWISVLSSFAERTFLDAGVPGEKLVRIPLGVDATMFHPVAGRDGPFRILYVGRLELCKGVQYLLQAFSRLKMADAELVLAGPVMPEARPLLEKYAGERVRVLGPVSRSELPRIYQGADVLVFPTVYDAFGLVIIEAMACGIPVITTTHSGGPDVIDDGTDGFIIPIRNVDAIEEKVRWMAQHKADARDMGRAARDKIVRDFTRERYAERLVNTYRQIISDGASSRGHDCRGATRRDAALCR